MHFPDKNQQKAPIFGAIRSRDTLRAKRIRDFEFVQSLGEAVRDHRRVSLGDAPKVIDLDDQTPINSRESRGFAVALKFNFRIFCCLICKISAADRLQRLNSQIGSKVVGYSEGTGCNAATNAFWQENDFLFSAKPKIAVS